MKVRSFFQYENQFARPLRLVSYLCVLCAVVVNIPAQDFKTIHDGVEHAVVNYRLGNDPVKINLLRLDLKKVRLDIHHAFDKAIGLETTSSMALRKQAVAGINGGFFRLDKSVFAGDASALLIIDQQILSETQGTRVALILENSSKKETWASILGFYNLRCIIERVKGIVGTRGRAWPTEGINREIKTDDVVIYTPEFGSQIENRNKGIAVVISKGRVLRISEKDESLSIPDDGFVVLASGSQRESFEKLSRSKEKFFRPCWYEAEPLRGAGILRWNPDDAVSGRPQLIKNGKIDISWEEEKLSKDFVETRHPRTAVAIMKDEKFLMITVDGRQPGVSVGMNLHELAYYLFSLGAHNAMNLDGGGSTTMVIDGKVINTPSDKEGERKVGDAILVTLRKKK